MKKYIAALFFVIFTFAASAEAFTPAPLNPDFIKWREGATKEAQNAESAKARSASPVLRGGAAPAPKDMSHLKNADFSMFLNEALTDGSRPAARALSLDSAARRGASRRCAIRGDHLSAGSLRRTHRSNLTC